MKFRLMLGRRGAYRRALLDQDGKPTDAGALIIADLARFCRAQQSTVVVSPIGKTVDTHATMLAEGRREVFNRITYYLNLNEQQIYQLMEREHDRIPE